MGIIVGSVGVNEGVLYWETKYQATDHHDINSIGIGTNDCVGAGLLGTTLESIGITFGTQEVYYNDELIRTLNVDSWNNGTDAIIRHLLNLNTGTYKICHEGSLSTWHTVVDTSDNLDTFKVWRPAIDIFTGAIVTLYTDRSELNYVPPAGALTFEEVIKKRLKERGDNGTGVGGSVGGYGAGTGGGSGGSTPTNLPITEPANIRTIAVADYKKWLKSDRPVNLLVEAKYSDTDIEISGIDAYGMDVSVDGFSATVQEDLSGLSDSFVTAQAIANITDGDMKYFEIVIDNLAIKDDVSIGLVVSGNETNDQILGTFAGSIGFKPNGVRGVDGIIEQTSVETTNISTSLDVRWSVG